MMNMLREFKKKRKLMMGFIILLGVGLAGGALLMAFAPGSAPPPQHQQQLPPDTSDIEALLAGFSDVLEEEPENQEVISFVASLYWQLANQLEDAERQQQARNTALGYQFRLIELNPDDVQLMAEVAVLANSVGNNNLVQEIFEKALQSLDRNPEDVDLMTGVAVLADIAGHIDNAQEIFERALQLDGENINALTHYGLYLMNRKGDFESAVVLFARALEQDMSDYARDIIKTYYITANQRIEAH